MLAHLRNSTFVELRPSSVHGVGVFAARDIPGGVDPFATNGPPSGSIVDLSPDELASLPEQVQSLVRKFIVPHREVAAGGLAYGVPQAGLNALDSSYYLNSNIHAPNVEFGEEHDERGLTTVVSMRDIRAGEELLLPYEFQNAGRTRGAMRLAEEGNVAIPLADASICRICQEEVDAQAEDSMEIECDCASRWFHKNCCKTWFASKVEVRLSQNSEQQQLAGLAHIDNRWAVSCHVRCEVCSRALPAQFVTNLLDSAAESRPDGVAARLRQNARQPRRVLGRVVEEH